MKDHINVEVKLTYLAPLIHVPYYIMSYDHDNFFFFFF